MPRRTTGTRRSATTAPTGAACERGTLDMNSRNARPNARMSMFAGFMPTCGRARRPAQRPTTGPPARPCCGSRCGSGSARRNSPRVAHRLTRRPAGNAIGEASVDEARQRPAGRPRPGRAPRRRPCRPCCGRSTPAAGRAARATCVIAAGTSKRTRSSKVQPRRRPTATVRCGHGRATPAPTRRCRAAPGSAPASSGRRSP